MFWRRKILIPSIMIWLSLLPGCALASASSNQADATLPTAKLTTPTRVLSTPTMTETYPPLATIGPTALPYRSCQPETLVLPGHFLFSRPISSSANPTVDITYRYGTTSDDTYYLHHGVDMHNPRGTNVYAAAGGRVVAAGNDYRWGPFLDFYGNLVILAHDLPEVDQPVYTLYGHLSQVEVQVGEMVARGDKLGEVGSTGVAIGSHLHFEVRLGENDYGSTRNPELWLLPPEGAKTGVLAVYIVNNEGNDLEALQIRLRYLHGAEKIEPFTQYPEQYHGSSVNSDDGYGEQFAVGDLPAGTYEIAFTYGRVYKRQVKIEPGKLTLAAFCLAK